jgi:hypothetical protein
MQTHKILTIILIILAVFFGVSVLFRDRIPQPIPESVATTTPTVVNTTATTTIVTTSTSTTTKPVVQTFPKNITLSISNSYTFPNGAILTLKQINDSRCAIDVQCIWAGNVIAKLNIKEGTGNESFELKYPIDNNETSVYKYKEYKILISDIKPNKGIENQKLELKNYNVTLNISN